jgi:hypothetical protein
MVDANLCIIRCYQDVVRALIATYNTNTVTLETIAPSIFRLGVVATAAYAYIFADKDTNTLSSLLKDVTISSYGLSPNVVKLLYLFEGGSRCSL